MPRGDRTGPRGRGANTGRAAGFCAGFEMPGYANPVQNRGFGMGLGRGCAVQARGFGAYAVPHASPASNQNIDPEREKQQLKRQAADLQAEIDFVNKRLDEVESKAASE